MLKQNIETFCEGLGVDTLGFIPCRRFEELIPFYNQRKDLKIENEFEEQEIEKRINPKYYMEEGKTIISIAFPYYHEDEEKVDNGFSIYTKRADYHRIVKAYLNQICTYIESLGGQAISFVDSNTLPERYIAYLAGLGFIGKNNMLITKRYGSYVFLGEIITDLEIACKDCRSQEEIKLFKECGSCMNCFKECPTKSINPLRSNPNICLSYLTQKKALEDKEIKLLKGNIFGCDFCQLQCPYNEKIEKNVLKEFETLAHMNDTAHTYASMDNKYFKEKISGTSCGWRGKNVIRRNAIIHLAKVGQEIQEFKGDSSYINDYIERLTKEKHHPHNS